MKKVISSTQAPAAVGPYSHATAYAGLVFSSGQLPLDPATGKLAGNSIEEQSEQALLNLKHVLEAGGASLETVLKTTCFLANIADFAAFNAVYSKYFTQDFPARSCFAVKDLPLGALVEVEAIACAK